MDLRLVFILPTESSRAIQFVKFSKNVNLFTPMGIYKKGFKIG